MSDSSPLIMNLGADVAATAAPGTAINAPGTVENGGFSGVLQSVIQKETGINKLNNLSPEQILANQLLMSQLQDQDSGASGHSVLANNPFLTDGNSLPGEDVDLAWEGLFGQYDSTNPDEAYLFSAEGDNDGYTINNLLPEDADESLSVSAESVDDHDSILSQNENDQSKHKAQHQEQVATSLSAPVSKTEPQAAAIVNTGSNDIRNKEGLSGITLDQNAAQTMSKHAGLEGETNPEFSQQNNSKGENQEIKTSGSKQEQNNLSELTKFHNALNKTDMSESNVKLDANNAQLNIQDAAASRANSSNTSNATTAYSAISSLNGPLSTSAPQNSNVIAQLTVPPTNPDWGNIVGDRVQWMANQNIQQAHIRLNPPELGLLEVRINIGQDQQTHVSFSSPHSQVRDVLESSVPRLREMFGENGLTLGDVDVSQHSMSEQKQPNQDGDDKSSSQNSFITQTTDASDEMGMDTALAPQPLGMLDTYA